jgi:hypothetical protein
MVPVLAEAAASLCTLSYKIFHSNLIWSTVLKIKAMSKKQCLNSYKIDYKKKGFIVIFEIRKALRTIKEETANVVYFHSLSVAMLNFMIVSMDLK